MCEVCVYVYRPPGYSRYVTGALYFAWNVHIHSYTHTHIHTYTHTHIHTYTHTHICTYAHTHIHTRTMKQEKQPHGFMMRGDTSKADTLAAIR